MARLVEGVQDPAAQYRVVFPLREPRVRRAELRAAPGCEMSRSTRIDAMITPAWHTATTVFPA